VTLEAFGVKNLRCLTDTGLVPIRPITVLVGRNSSGKSTFLRAFPLLRQSVETARNSPILWYHERYVDFGSLKDAANNRLREASVTFQFRLRSSGTPVSDEGDILPDIEFDFDVAMTLAGEETPYVSSYELRADGSEARWDFDARGGVSRVVENGKSSELVSACSLQGTAHLLPAPGRGERAHVNYVSADEMSRGRYRPLMPGAHAPAGLVTSGNQLDIGFYLTDADRMLASIMSRVAYLAPLRVSAQRSYRIQNLADDEVDPDGKNLPMFLRSLTPAETESFGDFTRDALGFETQIKTSGIHAEILIKGGKARRFVNLVDVGFGYSEVLPLAAVLWGTCIRPTMHGREPAPLVAIEQPELHLHPAHQAKLARMFVEAVSKSPGTKIIIETHSESLINGLGKLIHDGAIKAADVQIALFDQDEETEETTVRLAGYRENGALRDWPYGFLSPVAERRVPPAAE
jgi:hypothetical protein